MSLPPPNSIIISSSKLRKKYKKFFILLPAYGKRIKLVEIFLFPTHPGKNTKFPFFPRPLFLLVTCSVSSISVRNSQRCFRYAAYVIHPEDWTLGNDHRTFWMHCGDVTNYSACRSQRVNRWSQNKKVVICILKPIFHLFCPSLMSSYHH